MSREALRKRDTEVRGIDSLLNGFEAATAEDVSVLVFDLLATSNHALATKVLFGIHKSSISLWVATKTSLLRKCYSHNQVAAVAEMLEVSSQTSLSGSCRKIPGLCVDANLAL